MTDNDKKQDLPTTIPTENSIGLRIKAARETKKLSQIDMHKMTGLSRTVLINYEAGRHSPGSREIKLICDVLQISPNYLIYGTEEPHKIEEGFAGLVLSMGGDALIPLGLLLPVMGAIFDRDEVLALLTVMESLIKAKSPDIYNHMMMSLNASPNRHGVGTRISLDKEDTESIAAYLDALKSSLSKAGLELNKK